MVTFWKNAKIIKERGEKRRYIIGDIYNTKTEMDKDAIRWRQRGYLVRKESTTRSRSVGSKQQHTTRKGKYATYIWKRR